MDRYARQRKLIAVGDLGQARIAGALFEVSAHSPRELAGVESEGSPAHLVERDYLERAGARHFALRVGPAAPFVHAAHFEHAEACEQAGGAWRALLQLRAALADALPAVSDAPALPATARATQP